MTHMLWIIKAERSSSVIQHKSGEKYPACVTKAKDRGGQELSVKTLKVPKETQKLTLIPEQSNHKCK